MCCRSLANSQPRLGPKPFSIGSSDVHFDKVFSVPQAPGTERSSIPQDKSTESSDGSVDEQKDSDEKEGTEKFSAFLKICIKFQKYKYLIDFQSIVTDAVVYRNGNNGHTIHKSDSSDEDVRKTISTAERRKVSVYH